MKNASSPIRKYMPFFIPLLIFMLFFMSIFMITYQLSIRQIKTKTMEQADNTVRTAVSFIESDLINAYNAMDQIASQTSISEIAYGAGDLQVKDVYKMIRTRKAIRTLTPTTPLVADCLLVFDTQPSLAISPTTIMSDMQKMFDSDLFRFGELSYDAFIDQIQRQADTKLQMDGFMPSARMKSISGGEFDAIPYVKTLPVYTDRKIYGIVLLDTNRIERLLIPEQSAHITYGITDADGNLLAGTLSKPSVLGGSEISAENDGMVVYLSSTQIRLNYYVRYDDGYFREQLGYFTIVYQILSAVMVLASLALLLCTLRFVVRPLSAIADRLNPPFGKKDTMITALSQGVDTLCDANLNMKSRLDKWLPVVKTNTIQRLLSGDGITDGDMELLHELAQRPDSVYRVMIFELACIGQNEVIQEQHIDLISQAIKAEFACSVIQLIGKCSFVAVACNPASLTREEYDGKLGRIIESLRETIGGCTVGVGSPCRAVGDIFHSYNDAGKTLTFAKKSTGAPIVWFDSQTDSRSRYYFSRTYAEKLCRLLLAGEGGQADALYDRLVQENSLSLPRAGDRSFEQFYYDMRGVLYQISFQLEISNLLQEIPEYGLILQPDAYHRKMKDLLRRITLRALEQKRQSGLLDSLLRYIEKNYTDSNMSLKLLSSEFNVTDKYVSLLIKEKTGRKFSEYLEELRLSMAKDLLGENAYPIGRVAERVGYSTPSAFYKAFKKKYGVTPSAWEEARPHQ